MCKKLSPGGEYEDMMEFTSVPLPYDPTLQVKGVVPTSPRVFKSAMMPYTLEFVTQHAQKTHRVMFKIGDDVRQDQLILQMITLMDDLLKRVRLDLRLHQRVMSTGHLEGLVEFVPHATPLRYVKHSYLSSETQSSSTHALGISRAAMSNFVKSCTGYAVVTYILGIGLTLGQYSSQENGQLFHIDFGYVFGRGPSGTLR